MKRILTALLALALLCSFLPAGTLSDAGITVDDIMEVVTYYKGIAEAGDKAAYETEYKFLKVAAELGSGQAMTYLGELFQGGFIEDSKTGDPIATAFYWWTKAAENGQPRALSNIGLVYEHKSVPGGGSGYGDVEYNPARALELYKEASDRGDSKSARYAGLAYQNGIGTAVDEEKAFEYFELAAQRDDSTGIVYLADYLLTGRACEQDVGRAISLYQGIIDSNGHDAALSALYLGNIYSEGVYVEKDTAKAADYYRIVLSSAPGSSNAEEAAKALAAL